MRDAGSGALPRAWERRQVVTTVRFNHLKAALLAVAAAGLLAAVGLLVALYAQPAEANYPGTPGKIYYSGWDGQDLEIYSIDPDGGSIVNVTQNNADDRHPYYSPNGTRIAYSSDADGDWDIYTISTTGGSRTNV